MLHDHINVMTIRVLLNNFLISRVMPLDSGPSDGFIGFSSSCVAIGRYLYCTVINAGKLSHRMTKFSFADIIRTIFFMQRDHLLMKILVSVSKFYI